MKINKKISQSIATFFVGLKSFKMIFIVKKKNLGDYVVQFGTLL